MSMRIVVTGVRGAIAPAVVKLAAAHGHTVTGIDRPSAAGELPPGLDSFVVADAAHHDELVPVLSGCDAVIHLAALSSPHLASSHEVHHNNVMASYNVLTIAAELGIGHVCLASSVNAVNGEFTREPHYAYFPLDEEHPTGNEDPYSLSKWISEQQADSMARRHSWMTITSLRFHWTIPDRDYGAERLIHPSRAARQLWGYTSQSAAARACLLSLTAGFTGHERFYIVAPDTIADLPSAELQRQYYPEVPLRRELAERQGFFDCTKAERLLGWRHDKEDG